MKERFPRTILDQDDRSHSFELGLDFPLLDGERCEMVSIGPDAIQLAPTIHLTHVISFAPDAFWQGMVGDQPTEAEAGQLFAHYLAQWTARRACAQTIAALQSLLAARVHLRKNQELFLPNYRFDSITQQVLESFDGTEETTRLLARILKQDPVTVIHWAQLAGKTLSVDVVRCDAQSTQHAESERMPVASEPKGKPQHFRWTAAMAEQLVSAFQAHEGTSINAVAEEISSQNGWPLSAVKYKIYELKLPQKKRAARGQEQEARLEGDGEGTNQQAETQRDQPDLVLPQEQLFNWDDEKIQQLTSAFMQSEAESTVATCREIAAQFGWPLKKVTGKVNVLRLPGHKQNRQRAAARVPKIIRENELLVGHFVWRVVIDGNLTQWRLDYNYGNFPEHLLGAEIYYQECPYLVDQIFVQELRVSTRIAQSADQGEMEVLPVSA